MQNKYDKTAVGCIGAVIIFKLVVLVAVVWVAVHFLAKLW